MMALVSQTKVIKFHSAQQGAHLSIPPHMCRENRVSELCINMKNKYM